METTIDALRLPFPLQLINRVGEHLKRRDIHLVDLSEESLLEAARRNTGLNDWGHSHFRTALRTLLSSYEREADLSLLGTMAVRRECIRMLSNHLRLEDQLYRHPEILDIPLPRPLFIIGSPRAGTTLLHNLLSQDPTARAPLLWELLWPSRPPLSRPRQIKQRIKGASWLVRAIHSIIPQLRHIHPLDPVGPEECIFLFQTQFVSILFVLTANIPGYMNWILQHDMIPEYKYYRHQLQVLQWCSPGKRWVLKTFSHLLALDALLTVFPDARVIQVHRDPERVVGSLCSLTATLASLFSDRVDLTRLGERCLRLLGTAVDRAMNVRESADPSRFYDVHYGDLVADPIGMVRRIYEFFGYVFTPGVEAHMERWLRTYPRDRHGAHQYSLDQFGLDSKRVNDRFALYIDRFKVKPDRERSSSTVPDSALRR